MLIRILLLLFFWFVGATLLLVTLFSRSCASHMSVRSQSCSVLRAWLLDYNRITFVLLALKNLLYARIRRKKVFKLKLPSKVMCHQATHWRPQQSLYQGLYLPMFWLHTSQASSKGNWYHQSLKSSENFF